MKGRSISLMFFGQMAYDDLVLEEGRKFDDTGLLDTALSSLACRFFVKIFLREVLLVFNSLN